MRGRTQSLGLAVVVLLCGVAADAQVAGGQVAAPPGQAQVSWPDCAAGVYEVAFSLQVEKAEQTVSSLGQLQVSVPGYPAAWFRELSAVRFPRANTPVGFLLCVDNWRAQSLSAAVAPPPGQAAPGVTVGSLTIRRCKGPVIGTVWPGKITYRRGEAASGFVSVFNGDAQPRQVTLSCWLESDLDRVRSLRKEELTLAPGERREVPLAWNAGKETYGFALRASLREGSGRELSRGEEYFSVTDNVWEVGICSQGRNGMPPYAPGPNASAALSAMRGIQELLEKELAKPCAPVGWSYGNYWEFYAWSPDDFFNLAPAGDAWYSGTGSYTYLKQHLQLAIEWLHRRGMWATAYLNPFVNGYGTEPVVMDHPEWFVYGANGELATGSYHQRKLEIGEAPPIERSDKLPFMITTTPYALSLSVNIATLEPIDWQVEQIVKSQKMFGWDGIRFDNCTYGAYGLDFWGKPVDGGDPQRKNELEARAWAHMRDTVWKRLGPSFVIGDNFGYAFRDLAPAAWDELASRGQLVMDEPMRSSPLPSSPTHKWKDWVAYAVRAGEAIRKNGGHSLFIGFDQFTPVDHLYDSVFTYATRTHTYVNYSADRLPLGNYAAFATRYSALLWDVERVKAWPQAAERVQVLSSGPVWWKELACVRTTPQGKRQYLLHLVNPPVQETVGEDPTNTVPAFLTNLTVKLTPAGGEKLSRAVLLTADPEMTQQVLPLSREGQQILVKVPQVCFWSLLVLE